MMVRRMLLVQEVMGSNPDPIKSPTRYHRLVIAATLKCRPWHKAAEMGTVHSLTPEKVLIEYNKDLIF